jgi:predicted dithiol-disulfide oxidoreductase (DUF899 family)
VPASFGLKLPSASRRGRRWVSAGETDFNYDFGASFASEEVAAHAPVYNYGSDPGFEDREGISIFARDEAGRVFHSYSTYARGIDAVNGIYQFLDLVPKGRDEPWTASRSSGSAATTSMVPEPHLTCRGG